MAKKNSLVLLWASSSTFVKRIFSFWLFTVSVLILVACGGGGSDDDTVPSASKDSTNTPTANVILTGKATYTSYPLNANAGIDYSMPAELPIRGAVVELHSSDGLVLDQQNTSREGFYTFQAPAESNVVVVVKAALGTPQRPDTKIVDNTQQQALYTLVMPIRVRAIDLQQNFNADSGWDGQQYSGIRAAAPFAILDTLHKSQNLVRSADSNVVFPTLLVNWSKRNIPTFGRIDLGEIGTSHLSSDRQIYILGAADVDTDEYDSHIIAHEWGHYFEHAFSRSDSLGGQHILNDILDPSVAFSEAWGNAFAAMALDNALYIDSMGNRQKIIAISMDIETNSVPGLTRSSSGIPIDGFYSEASIHEILYDLYDSSDDENLQLGFTPIYNALVGKHKTSLAFTSVFSFIDALLEQDNINDADVRQLAANENIHDGDQYEAFSQKIYTLLPSGGTRVEQDRNGDTLQTKETYGRISGNNGNKLDNRIFFKYFSPLSGCYTIDIVPQSGGDVVIHVPAQANPLDRSGPDGNELYHITLSANQSGSIAVGSKFSSTKFSAQMSLTPGQCNE
ncbi:hypothetical protein MNBD_GAMMA16-1305 [hydrothermal vent metagenome]|uniref:Uncharacterized protein n=1 Tax=hydrothermal vent metagenome TaxID=652676 RepID=A0A3B0Z456_9ZZZZ